MPARGPSGKFISKKKSPSTPTSISIDSETSKKGESKKEEKPCIVVKSPLLKSSNFGGIPIRRIYTQGKWFFAVEDVVALTGVSNIKEYLEQIKNKNKELQKDWETMIEKFDYQTEDKTEFLECADTESILKIVYVLDKPLPGPFSRWLRETAQKSPV